MDTLHNFLSRPLAMAMDTMNKCRSIPHLNDPMPIDTWSLIVMTSLRGWTSESVAMWLELTGYRLEKAFHCKVINTCNEHEFVAYEFSNKRQKLELRTDRSAGGLKDSVSTSSFSSSSVESCITDFEDFSPPPLCSSPESSNPSLPLASVKQSISRMSSSIRQTVRRLSENSLPRPSAISSNQCLATDTVTRINGRPSGCQVLRTVTFRGKRSSRPSLWDVMILAKVVRRESITYKLLERQCYWFADTIFGLLEKWASIHKNGIPTEEKRRAKWWKGLNSTGSLGVVPVYRRDAVHIDEIWDDFMKERNIMDMERKGYEQERAEEIRKAEELAGQVSKLEQRLEEERHMFKRQIADQQRQLEEQDRQWHMRLQQKDEEVHRRFNKPMGHHAVWTSTSI